MECCLIPLVFLHVPILYPLNTMFPGGIKSRHFEKMSQKTNITKNYFNIFRFIDFQNNRLIVNLGKVFADTSYMYQRHSYNKGQDI